LNVLNKKLFKMKTNYESVAKLIADKNIVALFQGQSEIGHRALGNRSILYDPRDTRGKDRVNKVKHREGYRPFAGTILLDHAENWFDMRGLKESPYMMYAVKVLEDKKDKIPAIVHVDNTCRIQTLTKNQNEHFYNLIKAFYDLTGVPILFNTSYNLAGETMVEYIGDAKYVFNRSDINYLYLPETQELITKNK
jgi:carbamoyltransferase